MSSKVKQIKMENSMEKISVKSSVKNLKIFCINKGKYNFAVFKLVSLVGVGVFSNMVSNGIENYLEKAINNVEYKKEISNLNIEFNRGIDLANYNLNVKFNAIKSGPIEITDKTSNEKIEEVINEITELTEEEKMLKYKEIMKVLEMNETSVCGMNLSREFESIIIDIANRYGFDPRIMLTFGNIESDGKWDNNGVISSTNDYGVFQINEVNHQHIEEVFGYTSDDLRYDPIKNAEAAAYLIRNIMLRNDVNSLDEIFGMYNGWTDWRNIDWSIEYVNSCLEIMNTYFPNYTYENNKELLKKM